MRYSFILNSALRLFRGDAAGTLGVFCVSAVTALGFIFAFTAYFSIAREFESLSDNFNVTVVFEPGANEEELTPTLVELKNNEAVAEVEFISTAKAKEIFLDRFGRKGEELIIGDEFSAMAKLTIEKEFQTSELFYNFVEIAGTLRYVDEIIFREDFVESFFDLKDRSRLIMIIAVIFFLPAYFFLLNSAFSNIFQRRAKDFDLLISLGSGRLFAIMPQMAHVFLSGIFGLVFGLCFALALYEGLKGDFLWLGPELYKTFIIGAIAAAAFEAALAFRCALRHSKEKKYIALYGRYLQIL